MQIVRLSGPAAETPGDWRNRLLANLGKSIWSTFENHIFKLANHIGPPIQIDRRNRLVANNGKASWSTFVRSLKIQLAHTFKLANHTCLPIHPPRNRLLANFGKSILFTFSYWHTLDTHFKITIKLVHIFKFTYLEISKLFRFTNLQTWENQIGSHFKFTYLWN